jgi:hypothetical protein
VPLCVPHGRARVDLEFVRSLRSVCKNKVDHFFCMQTATARHTPPTNSLERGGGVSARAHACVALGRCVAFVHTPMTIAHDALMGLKMGRVNLSSIILVCPNQDRTYRNSRSEMLFAP